MLTGVPAPARWPAIRSSIKSFPWTSCRIGSPAARSWSTRRKFSSRCGTEERQGQQHSDTDNGLPGLAGIIDLAEGAK